MFLGKAFKLHPPITFLVNLQKINEIFGPFKSIGKCSLLWVGVLPAVFFRGAWNLFPAAFWGFRAVMANLQQGKQIMGNKENEGFIIFSISYYMNQALCFLGWKKQHRKGQSFGVPPWLLTTGSLGLPSCRHQKSGVFNDHCWELKNAKVYFFLNFDFEVICSLVYFMISSFDLKKDNLCTTYMTRNHWQFSSFMVHVSTISYECYTNSNPKSLGTETENR